MLFLNNYLKSNTFLPKTYHPSLNLTKNGAFEGQFVVDSLSITIPFNMFYYDQTSRFVLTDIDGTITESDIKGHVFPVFGFSAHHDHVVEMFHKIGDNGYNVVYLTARSIASDIDTREYLFEVSSFFLNKIKSNLELYFENSFNFDFFVIFPLWFVI